jgi:hypothetical protein
MTDVPTKFVLQIATDNAAFAGDPRPELARLLRETAGLVAASRMSGALFDINGNRVGEFDTVDANEAWLHADVVSPRPSGTGDDPAACQDCEWRGTVADCNEPADLWERVEPGERVPAGECPDCGALCSLVKETR